MDPHTGICIYKFITPLISNQSHDCFHLFTQVLFVLRNLWLTAWSYATTLITASFLSSCPVGRDSRICRLHLYKGIRLSKYPGYDVQWFDGEGLVLELRGMWSTPSEPLLPGLLWPGVVVPVRVLSVDQIELFDNLLYLKLFNCV